VSEQCVDPIEEARKQNRKNLRKSRRVRSFNSLNWVFWTLKKSFISAFAILKMCVMKVMGRR